MVIYAAQAAVAHEQNIAHSFDLAPGKQESVIISGVLPGQQLTENMPAALRKAADAG